MKIFLNLLIVFAVVFTVALKSYDAARRHLSIYAYDLGGTVMRIAFSPNEILETIRMVENQNLDIRTITMGISLRDCADSSSKRVRQKVYDKITGLAQYLVKTREELEVTYGIPIINKRISVTPISIVGEACSEYDYVGIAKTLDKAAKEVGVNFIGGFSALVQKGFTKGDLAFMEAIPEALSRTDLVCSSVNVASTKASINLDAVLKHILLWLSKF